MLHLRNDETDPISPIREERNRRKTMDRIYRALGVAVALGTSGLMFALTLA